MMNGRQKLYFLLKKIVDARAIAPSGQPLIINPTNDLSRRLSDIELAQLFTKLEKDEHILEVLKATSGIKTIHFIEDADQFDYSDDGCWHIKLLPNFDSYYLSIQKEPEYQEFFGIKPTVGPTTSGNSLMTYEQKLDLVIKALIEARKATRKDRTTTLYLNSTNGLDRLDREEIRNILLQIQDQGAIKVNPKTNRLLPLEQQPVNAGYFFLDILEGFNNWYARYLMQQKSKLENLEWLNLLKILDVCSDIQT